MNNKINKRLMLLIIIILAVVVYFLYRSVSIKLPSTSITKWETYTSSSYNFSFDHPSDMNFKNLVYDSSQYSIRFKVWGNPKNFNLKNWILDQKKTNLWIGPNKLDLVPNYKVGSDDAIRFWANGTTNDTGKEPGKCSQSCPSLNVYFIHNDKIYLAELDLGGEVENYTQTITIFDQILSTFKFIE